MSKNFRRINFKYFYIYEYEIHILVTITLQNLLIFIISYNYFKNHNFFILFDNNIMRGYKWNFQ